MKKLLIGTAAVALGLSMASSAEAQGVKLDVGGHMKGYVSWTDTDDNVDQDGLDITATDPADDDVRAFDILRESELHFSGESTLDNGLTVGAHIETDIDGTGGDDFDTEEAYAYFSGAWGRLNFGLEDGATYLLQVAAPSADANLDGLRQYVQPANFTTGSPTTNINDGGAANTLFSFNGVGNGGLSNPGVSFLIAGGDFFDVDGSGGASAGDLVFASRGEFGGSATGPQNPLLTTGGLTALVDDMTRYDYDHAVTGYDNKLTYMTPVFQGFQAGVSYTPDVDESSNDYSGNGQDDVAGDFYGDAWEIAARWEGMVGEVGINFGGGYSHINLEDELDDADVNGDGVNDGFVAFISRDQVVGVSPGDTLITMEDKEGWNVGLDLDWGPFGLGGAYTEQESGLGGALEADTWVAGLDYTTGPFKLGASYYEQDRDFFDVSEIETERWAGGVVYTYGPGMTFRGSVNYTEVELPQFGTDVNHQQDHESTSVLLGTQINF